MGKQLSEKDRCYNIKIERILGEHEEKAAPLSRKLYEWLWRIAFEDQKRTQTQKERAIRIMETRKLM